MSDRTIVEAGKEAEFIGYRLNDIIYLAENTRPTDEADWKGYAQSMMVLLARQARMAQTALVALLAQRIEHGPSKLGVEGSSPSERAISDCSIQCWRRNPSGSAACTCEDRSQ